MRILRKIILAIWLLAALALTVVYFIWPREGLEIIVLVFVIPAAVVNMWEWFMQEVANTLYGSK